jgi:hypothetical protein
MRRRGCGRSQRWETLRAVWVQQSDRDQDGLRWRGKGELPPGALAIGSPYDPRPATGSTAGWAGVATRPTSPRPASPTDPTPVVHVATTVATTGDVDTVAGRHADLARGDLLPAEHLVDAGYGSVDHLLAARADHGVELVGPLPPDSGWQARDEVALTSPGSRSTGTASRSPAPTARPAATGARPAAATACRSSRPPSARPTPTPCPDRARRTRSPVLARHLTFRPRTQYETQQQLRAGQATPAWRERYAHRAGVEGTIAQAARRSDLHQARYRGLAKTHPQHVLTALALNLVRLDAWLTGIPLGGSWVSRLTRLRAAPAPT